MNGHQGLKPTDVVGPPTDVVGPPTDVVGPPHSPLVKMAFSLEEVPFGSTGFFTLNEEICGIRVVHEILAARWAMERITADELRALGENIVISKREHLEFAKQSIQKHVPWEDEARGSAGSSE
jgi:hypothetical protein